MNPSLPTPHNQGTTEVPRLSDSYLSQVRAHVSLPALRRARGILPGAHESHLVGRGHDFDELTEYRPGDEVSDIDWLASARSGQPVIKRFVRQSTSDIVLIVDTGQSMAADAPSGESKARIAVLSAAIVAYVAHSRGDAVGMVAGDSQRMENFPVRSGDAWINMLCHRMNAMITLDAPPSNVGGVLERARRVVSGRALCILITDETHPGPEDIQGLKRLSARHDVAVIHCDDANLLDPHQAGAWAMDIDDDVPEFLNSNQDLAQTMALIAQQRRLEVDSVVQRYALGSAHVRGTQTIMTDLSSLSERPTMAKTRRRLADNTQQESMGGQC
ncbi:DUF58 domain-containing protein [Actinomyces vulturis]|uniref:DUF58 domain-containing protein n=1 Tax=Actinomyces vulturis TaxID=1857645 RepID=UPI00082A896E|nr:DUF58 domain-containing protein [Actinomyces vulturis]